MDTELNHELEALSEEFRGHVFYMKSLYDFPTLLQQHEYDSGPEPGHYNRSENIVGEECWKWIQEVYEQDIDFDRMNARWRL